MMDKLVNEIDGLKSLINLYGISGGIFFIIGIVIFIILYTFIQKRIEYKAKELSDINLKKFQANLDESLQKNLKSISFKLDSILEKEKANLQLKHEVALKSINTKITIWQKLYSIYIEFKNVQLTLKNKEEYNAYQKRSIEVKKEIVANSFYFNDLLLQKFVEFEDHLSEFIGNKYLRDNTNDSQAHKAYNENYVKAWKNIKRLETEIPIIIKEQLNTDYDFLQSDKLTKEALKEVNESIEKKLNKGIF